MIWQGLADLYKYRELVTIWTLREIRARYKQTLLGFAWALFQPVAFSIVFAIVFSFFLRVPSDGVPYPIFVFSGIVPWTFFARSLNDSIPSIANNHDLIRKIYFPREIFPIARVAMNLVDFVFGFIVFVGMMLYYQIQLRPEILFIVLLVLVQIAFTLGIVLAGSALNVLVRDVNQLVPVLVQLWMYATPIIYPLSIVPQWLLPLYLLNPMALLIESYRGLLLHGKIPGGNSLLLAAAISLIVFVLGYWLFKRLELRFVDFI